MGVPGEAESGRRDGGVPGARRRDTSRPRGGSQARVTAHARATTDTLLKPNGASADTAERDGAGGRRIGPRPSAPVVRAGDEPVRSRCRTNDRRVAPARAVPLMHRGQVLGVINLIGAPGHTYSVYDL